MKKNLPFILASIITTFGASVLIAHAQGYAPLADIGIDTKSVTDSSKLLPTYLSGALKLIIALGGALSILMAIIAGTKYVAAGISPDAKKNAKSDITNALIGLALILSSYLILNTINPNLVALNFSLPSVVLPPTATSTANTAGAPWGDDTSDRNALKNASDIDINNPNCAHIGDTNCTSVYGISLAELSGLKTLSSGFHAANTNVVGIYHGGPITITGGTEYWLHGNKDQNIASNTSAHKPGVNGGYAIDLSKNNNLLNGFIMQNGKAPSQTGCSVGDHYQIGTAVYVDEVIAGNPPHWHVCYY